MPNVIDNAPALPNRALDIPEVAEYVHLSVPTIRRYIESGRLRAARVGGVWRIWPNDLLAFISGGAA